MNAGILRLLCATLLAAVPGVSLRAASPPAGKPILLSGADLVTVSHGVIPRGELLIVDGRIAAIGSRVDAPAEAVRIDLAGKRVYPGYIAADSVLGLTEIESVRATNDMAEAGAVNPNARALAAINPDSELLPVARANGVLSAHVVPQPGEAGVLSGQSALVSLDGWTWEDMAVRAPVGVHLYWPALGAPDWAPAEYVARARESVARRQKALTTAFADARIYLASRNAGTLVAADLRWEALVPVLQGTQPLFIHADRIAQLRDALAFVERERIAHPVLVGGSDAWRIADVLAARRIPVILGSAHSLPQRRWEGYDVVYSSAARLARAGVTFAIANQATPMAAANERNLPYQAASYAAYGLGSEAALRAITLTPAEILGVADRLGSLDVGKDATLFVADGDALDIRTRVERAWVRGREVGLETRQTRLHDRYRSKYEDAPRP